MDSKTYVERLKKLNDTIDNDVADIFTDNEFQKEMEPNQRLDTIDIYRAFKSVENMIDEIIKKYS